MTVGELILLLREFPVGSRVSVRGREEARIDIEEVDFFDGEAIIELD